MEFKIINSEARNVSLTTEMIFTDPPFDMPGKELLRQLSGIDADHMVLLTSMKQFISLMKSSGDWTLGFDFVLDQVVPKQSKSLRQPNYTHVNGFYLTRNKAKSAFNRKLCERSDCYDGSGYWPTILRAPRSMGQHHSLAKNEQAIVDILCSFDVQSVVDPFAGSGPVGYAAHVKEIDCTLIEKDADHHAELMSKFRFLGLVPEEQRND